MSIADKLTQVAENVPKVYEAGKIDFGRKKSVSGEALHIDDINPNKHSVGVNLTSDTVTDFSTVNVTARGKNLFNIFNLGESSIYTVNADGTVTIKGGNNYVWTNYTLGQLCPRLKVGDKFTFSFSKTGIQEFYIGGSVSTYLQQGKTYTATEEMLSNIFIIYGQKDTEADYAEEHVISWVQVEFGETVTEPQAYIETTYTPNADGTVEGVISISPIMNIFTDTEGVVINAEYYQDVENFNEDSKNLDWWDTMTKKNSITYMLRRFIDTDFSYLGGFNPPYTLKPTNASHMFFGSKAIGDIYAEEVDFGDCEDFTYCFSNVSGLTSVETIDTRGANSVNSMCSECGSIKMIGKVILRDDGSQTFNQSAFYSLYNIKEIRFEGVIASNVWFTYCSYLSAESAISAINCLKNYKETENEFDYTITLNSNIINRLNALGNTSPSGGLWVDYITELGWNY